jgi:hypothetical protein
MWAADTSVLREPNAAMWQELASFDMAGRCLNHPAELFPLLVGNSGFEVLNFREAFPDERD